MHKLSLQIQHFLWDNIMLKRCLMTNFTASFSFVFFKGDSITFSLEFGILFVAGNLAYKYQNDRQSF